MFIGIDVGSRATKGVLFDGNFIVESLVCDTGASPKLSGEAAFEMLVKKSGIKRAEIKSVVGTGYGRISLDFVNKTITELSCHARGAHFICPRVGTVIDVGGQDSKVIKVNKNGGMLDFTMNDKCAAGTGRFFEVAAKALEMNLSDFSSLPTSDHTPCEINSMCAVFAETEIISLLAKQVPVESIAAGINQAFAKRIGNMARKMGVANDVLFVGGAAKNIALKKSVAETLGLQFHEYNIDPQIMGALGAAVSASQL